MALGRSKWRALPKEMFTANQQKYFQGNYLLSAAAHNFCVCSTVPGIGDRDS